MYNLSGLFCKFQLILRIKFYKSLITDITITNIKEMKQVHIYFQILIY